MPLYEYECKDHGTFELLFKSSERPESVPCIGLTEDWEACPRKAKIQVSTPTMRPDKHWAGTKTQSGKIVHSSQEYEEENKYLVPATEGNMQAVRRNKLRKEQEKEAVHSKKVENFVAQQMAHVEIEPEGYTVKQQNKFKRMRRDG